MNHTANRVHNALITFLTRARNRQQFINRLFSLIGINFLLSGLSFVTTLLIANILGKERFGELSYAIAIGGYCVTIASCGQERTLVRDLVHSPKNFDEFTLASLLLRGSLLGLSIILLFAINPVIAEQHRVAGGGIVIVIALGLKALDLAPNYDAWNKMERHAIYLLAERCLYFACIWSVAFLLSGYFSVSTIAASMLGSVVLGLTLQYFWAFPQLQIQINPKIVVLALDMLKKNLWTWSAVLATLSFGGLSKIVLKMLSGNSELGGYSVAWQIVMLGSILTSQIGRIGNPRIAEIMRPGVKIELRTKFLIKYMSLMIAATSAITVPSLFFSKMILSVFRPEYASSSGPMAILGIYVMVVGIGQVATQYLITVHKERFYATTVILSGLLGMLLYVFLIPRWNALGAALAVLLSHGTLVLVHSMAVLCNLRTRNLTASNY